MGQGCLLFSVWKAINRIIIRIWWPQNLLQSSLVEQLMAMDEIINITRQIGRQQGENLYYRACYALLKHLQELVTEASDDLLRLQQSGAYGSPEDEYYPVYQIVHELQTSINKLIDQACHAQLACEEFCDVDPRFSARDLFSSLELPKANQ